MIDGIHGDDILTIVAEDVDATQVSTILRGFGKLSFRKVLDLAGFEQSYDAFVLFTYDEDDLLTFVPMHGDKVFSLPVGQVEPRRSIREIDRVVVLLRTPAILRRMRLETWDAGSVSGNPSIVCVFERVFPDRFPLLVDQVDARVFLFHGIPDLHSLPIRVDSTRFRQVRVAKGLGFPAKRAVAVVADASAEDFLNSVLVDVRDIQIVPGVPGRCAI